jgi:ABC-2 type transport system permease protein
MLGKIIPYVFISFLIFYLILVLGWTLFDIPMPTSQGLLFLLGLLFVTVMICLGLAISTVSQNQQQAIFMSMFILIPSILLSGFIFPLEAMPDYIRPVSYILPFTYFVEIVRGLLLKGNNFVELMRPFLVLFGFACVLSVVSIRRLEKSFG